VKRTPFSESRRPTTPLLRFKVVPRSSPMSGGRGHPAPSAGRAPTRLEVADPLAAHEAQLSTIRGIRIVIEEVRAKFKYGGNVDVATARLSSLPSSDVASRAISPPPARPGAAWAPTVSSPLQDWTRQPLAATSDRAVQASPRSLESASRASALSDANCARYWASNWVHSATLISWRLITTPRTSRATVAIKPPWRVTSSRVRSPRRIRIDVARPSPGHSILHRPFTVHLDHADRQEVRHRRGQYAVV